jgi:hypothetical protein
MRVEVWHVMLLCMVLIWNTAARAEPYRAEGVVRGPDDKPIEAAHVRLYIPRSGNASNRETIQPYAKMSTGTAGRYAFVVETQSVQASHGLIVVQKEGLAWNCRRWPLLGDMEADIQLAQPSPLAGKVMDDEGRPIQGVRVVLQSPQSSRVRGYDVPDRLAGELFATETDHQGRFRFMMLSADWQTDFLVEARGYATVRTQYLPDALYRIYRPGQTDLAFRLEPDARIRGTVIRDSDGRPIPGVEVRIGRTQTGVAYGFDSATSDQNGRFSFDRLPEGRLWVGAVSSYMPDADWVGWPVPVRTKAGETASDIQLRLTRGGLFEFTVRDGQDNAIADAVLTVFDKPGHCLAQGQTDATGLCRMRLPVGSYKLVEVGKWGYHTYEPYIFFNIEPGETVHREVTLRKADRIEGVVVDEEGRPASDVEVTLMPSPAGTVMTDKRGRFAMLWDKWFAEYTDTADRQFELIALDRQDDKAATIVIHKDMGPVRLTLERAACLTGTVVGPEAKPIEGALVSAMLRGNQWGMNLSPSKRLLTDRAGRFIVGPVPRNRTCEIRIRASKYADAEREIQTPGRTDRPLDIGTVELAPGSDHFALEFSGGRAVHSVH